MEYIIVIAFLLYIGYREWMYYKHIKDLELKLFAKDVKEYKALVDKPVKEPKKIEEDELVDPLDVNVDDAMKGIKK